MKEIKKHRVVPEAGEPGMKYTVFLVDDFLSESSEFIKLVNLSWEDVMSLLKIAKGQDADIVIRLEEAGD